MYILTWNIKSYFLWKAMKRYLWMSSAAVMIATLKVKKGILITWNILVHLNRVYTVYIMFPKRGFQSEKG